ncbi:TPA: hypothetical protein VCA04_002345 [Streptococcus suis]|uniref:hypothetical protein n=1 Tax=Streptococcus suis TaxID=1307 RepID=UPI001552EBD5|nr:hypothetical protein [Streptococcus suis]MCK4043200.1 hypothetical protein [Streptococcus suis]MCQ8262717.1 hypothetical protein [Streptococcus suis]NQM20824.1 hypothetical protein [Streptococcus suis]HEL1793438.1 hypothetical protein [Streptococcus suis]HEL1795474.1 hypothetical protein [Streptococcus suis]
MKQLVDLISNRKSNRTISKLKDVPLIKKVVELSYNHNEYNNSVGSAGGIFGLKLKIFTSTVIYSKTIFETKALEPLNFENIKEVCFSDDENFTKNSIIISIDCDIEKYLNMYGNCGIRYACIEAGSVIQNIQLLLLENNLQGYIAGYIKNDDILGLENPLLYYIIY